MGASRFATRTSGASARYGLMFFAGTAWGDTLGQVVLEEGLSADIEGPETEDDHMDVGLPARLALPGEGRVREVDLDAETEELPPEQPHLFALRDRVRRDEADADPRSTDILGGGGGTSRSHGRALPAPSPQTSFRSSFCAAVTLLLSDERGIAQHIAARALRQDALPGAVAAHSR